MSLIGTFTSAVKLGTLRGEAEVGFVPGNPDDFVAVDRIPAVHEATMAVLKARGALTAATATAAQFRPGQVTLASVTAAEELEAAHEAVGVAETRLQEIRNRERDRIRAARLPDEQRLRRDLLAALEEARERVAVLEAYKAETDRLVGGRRNYQIDTSHDWPELLNLDFWRETCVREGLL